MCFAPLLMEVPPKIHKPHTVSGETLYWDFQGFWDLRVPFTCLRFFIEMISSKDGVEHRTDFRLIFGGSQVDQLPTHPNYSPKRRAKLLVRRCGAKHAKGWKHQRWNHPLKYLQLAESTRPPIGFFGEVASLTKPPHPTKKQKTERLEWKYVTKAFILSQIPKKNRDKLYSIMSYPMMSTLYAVWTSNWHLFVNWQLKWFQTNKLVYQQLT